MFRSKSVRSGGVLMQNALLNLTILFLLLFLFGSVDRIVYDRRMRFWLLGWIVIFVSLLLHLHRWTTRAPLQYLIDTALDLFLFTLAGLCFLFSFLPRASRPRTILVGALFGIPSVILIVLCLAAPKAFWPICLTVLAGETIAILEARRLLAPAPGHARLIAQLVAILACVLMLLAAPRLPQLIPYLILCQIFLLAAVGLRNMCHASETRGCVAAILGLFTWAFSLPLRYLVEDRSLFHSTAPSRWNLWDLPMFLTAFGMVLIVLEENIRRVAARSEDYRQLFDSHPLPMYIFSLKTLRFLRVNGAAVLHYGYSAEEFAAMTAEDIRPPSELARFRRTLASEHRPVNQTHGWRHKLKNGRIIEVDIYRHNLLFEGESCNMVVALDVTQRNAAELRLRQTYKLESLGQLTSGIAHDFNNLLAILMGSLELVDRHNPAPTSRDLIQQAILSVRRGVALTRRLLAFSRNQPAEPGPISIVSLVDSIAAFLKTSLGTAISLDIVFDPGLWQAATDPNQLENAILNLTLNARDAMPHGGAVRIHAHNVTIEQNQAGPLGEINAGDYVLLTITDTGSGMSPAVLARATEPFFTTKLAGEGTGLGLNMVASFLQQSGGSLQIESKVDAGTTIQIYLPRANPATSVVSVPPAIAANPIPRGDESIVLVEDEPTIRHVLGILLRSLGYTVHDASDAATALAHIRNAPDIALLLTDVVLPRGMDGAALAAQARTLQPTLQVLFSSGYTRDVLLRESRIPEDAQLLTKPYQVTDLAQQVRLALNRPNS